MFVSVNSRDLIRCPPPPACSLLLYSLQPEKQPVQQQVGKLFTDQLVPISTTLTIPVTFQQWKIHSKGIFGAFVCFKRGRKEPKINVRWQQRGWWSWKRISDTPSCQETPCFCELLHRSGIPVHFSHPVWTTAAGLSHHQSKAWTHLICCVSKPHDWWCVSSTFNKLLHMQTFVPRLLAHHRITFVLQNPGWPTVKPLVHLKNLLLTYKAPHSPALAPPHQHGSKSVRSFWHTYQSDDGALGSELCSAEKGPDEAVDLFLLRIVFVIIRRNLQLLHQE